MDYNTPPRNTTGSFQPTQHTIQTPTSGSAQTDTNEQIFQKHPQHQQTLVYLFHWDPNAVKVESYLKQGQFFLVLLVWV